VRTLSKKFTYLLPAICLGLIVLMTVAIMINSNNRNSTEIEAQPKENLIMAPDINDATKWQQVFHDSFDKSLLDHTKWVTQYDWRQPSETGSTNWSNEELQWYMDGQVAITDGNAVLTAIDNPVPAEAGTNWKSYPYRSGMISTGRSEPNGPVRLEATYGYIEARMKLPQGAGLWSAFWLAPSNKQWPPEIDIMEYVGSDRDKISMTYHWQDADTQRHEDKSSFQIKNLHGDWHTYAIDWQPGKIDWYVDGIQRKTVTGSSVPDIPMEIILNQAIGGTWAGQPDQSTPFPNQVLIDHVSVYKRKSS
jgi:beta-glucanase (GH16 family)